MNCINWLDNYFKLFKDTIFQKEIYGDLIRIKDIILNASKTGNKTIFAGNGGSAAIASYCSVDLTKNAGVRSINFNEASLITCFSNDYGYEQWLARSIECYSDKGDVVVFISSSGKSRNIINAAKKSKEVGLTVITLTGFDSKNELKKLGDINLWVDSKAYNIIEMTHNIWLLAIVDMIIGKAEYTV